MSITDPLLIATALGVVLFVLVLWSQTPEQQRRRREKVARIAEREREADVRRAAAIIRALNDHLGTPKRDDDGENPG